MRRRRGAFIEIRWRLRAPPRRLHARTLPRERSKARRLRIVEKPTANCYHLSSVDLQCVCLRRGILHLPQSLALHTSTVREFYGAKAAKCLTGIPLCNDGNDAKLPPKTGRNVAEGYSRAKSRRNRRRRYRTGFRRRSPAATANRRGLPV